jgi:hypothetical protein
MPMSSRTDSSRTPNLIKVTCVLDLAEKYKARAMLKLEEEGHWEDSRTLQNVNSMAVA